MKTNLTPFNVIIIGGGLAGLSSAIHLSKEGISVLLIEKNAYPLHKVCGEYISNEVLPYLQYLEIDVFALGAQKINKLELSSAKGQRVKATLPLGGFGISRYTLDRDLSEKALQNGVKIIQDLVIDIQFSDDIFSVQTKNEVFQSKVVIGAYGKRASLDIKTNRSFSTQKSPFMAVKMHVKGDFPNDLVALHNFKGGYCGVSKVENNTVNLCYITNLNAFKPYKDIERFQEEVVYKNIYLKTIFTNSQAVFETPLTISQISFAKKSPVENHIMMCGDTAGMIHPLCGNGMSMAIRSAYMASDLIIKYLQGDIHSRMELEKAYEKSWNLEFKNRLRMGHFTANVFSKNQLSERLFPIVRQFPRLLAKIVTLTHGKPMIVK